MMGREEPLTIVAPAVLQEWLLNTLEVSHSHVQYPIVFHAHEPVPKRIQTQGAKQLQGQRLDLAGFNTTLVPLSHRVPCHGFVFDTPRPPRQLDSEKLQALSVPQGPLWGQLAAGKSVVLPTGERIDAEAVLRPQRPALRCLVGGDNDQPECFKSVAADADVLIHEATYTEAVAERVGPAPQHSSAARVARFAEQVGVPNLVLTHFSPRYRDAVANPDESSLPSAQDRASKTGRHCILEIQQEATRYYNGQLFLAEDHAHFQLTPSGVLSRVEG
jgi:ribonuclease Z